VSSFSADPWMTTGAKIYQYVGDEMVITWAEVDGRRDARPIAGFIAIEAAINFSGQRLTRDLA